MINKEKVKDEILELIKARTKTCPIKSTEIFQVLKDKFLIDYDMEYSRFGGKFRKIILKLRRTGIYPILASPKGYWWTEDDSEKSKYIERFQHRLVEGYKSLSGVRKTIKKGNFDLFDEIGKVLEQEPVSQ